MSLVALLKRKNNKTLFTTPSHGGHLCLFHKFYNWYRNDISETDAYNPQEALDKAEKRTSEIYGTKYTKFLTNGSTSGVIASVLASECKTIFIWDKAHPCHRNAAELANCKILEYSLPLDGDFGVYRAITEDKVKEIFGNSKYNKTALLITSPTYEGFAAKVKEISELCHKHGVKLIVDEAHGAMYPFSDRLPESAIKHADYTIQSLHKTAGGINPTALLHSNDNNPSEALSKINTTSPSYPMLATIEANIRFLSSSKGRRCIDNLLKNISALRLPLLNDDPTKILLKHPKLSGFELSEILYEKYGIEDERTNEKTTMLLCGIGTNKKMTDRLKKALNNLGF